MTSKLSDETLGHVKAALDALKGVAREAIDDFATLHEALEDNYAESSAFERRLEHLFERDVSMADLIEEIESGMAAVVRRAQDSDNVTRESDDDIIGQYGFCELFLQAERRMVALGQLVCKSEYQADAWKECVSAPFEELRRALEKKVNSILTAADETSVIRLRKSVRTKNSTSTGSVAVSS